MRSAVGLVAGVSLSFALSGCLAATNHGSHGASVSEVLSVAEAGSDVGNDRPQVSYDGLMVRRREVIALRIDAGADPRRLTRDLTSAEARSQLTVSPISPSVLDAAELERLAPALVLSLVPGATAAQGSRAMGVALRSARRTGVDVRGHAVESVLVHDLRFTLAVTHPAAVSRAIAREGILSDALGNYTTRFAARRLDIVYTGPLLSDRLLLSVRQGIARSGHVGVGAVTVTPRSAQGSGVYLADEPTPPPADFSASSDGHDHHH